MSRQIFYVSAILLLGFASAVKPAATPSPTPAPKKSFFSSFKPRVNPSATVPRTGAAVGRGAHLGVDRTPQMPTPKSTSAPKSKSSALPRKSPAPATSSKAAKSPAPTTTATPQGTALPKKETSPEEQLPRILSTPAESISPSPTSAPSATATTTPKATPSATATVTPTATASVSPRPRPTKVELTLTKFQPAHGSPGDRDYRAAQLSYRISVPNRMEYPTIHFTIETSSGKLFERVFQLPSGSAFVEPDDNIEHTVALDPVGRDDWASAYAKTDRATFSWSIEGQSS